LQLWGLDASSALAGDLWQHIFDQVKDCLSEETKDVIQYILDKGTLSTRILRAVGKDFSRPNLTKVYGRLSDVLNKNELF